MKDFTEKTIEEIIMSNQATIHLKGFCPLLDTTSCQYKLPSGKKVDILSASVFGDDVMLYVIELKKNNTDLAAINQAYGYLKELIQYFSNIGFQKMYAKVILVGKDFKLLPVLDFFSVPTEIYNYSYGLNGIQFNQQRVINPLFGDGSDIQNEGGAVIELERRSNNNSINELLSAYVNYDEPHKRK